MHFPGENVSTVTNQVLHVNSSNRFNCLKLRMAAFCCPAISSIGLHVSSEVPKAAKTSRYESLFTFVDLTQLRQPVQRIQFSKHLRRRKLRQNP